MSQVVAEPPKKPAEARRVTVRIVVPEAVVDEGQGGLLTVCVRLRREGKEK